MGYNLLNQPTFYGMHGWKYIRVTRHLETYVLQEAIDFNGAVSCFRVKLNNVWQPWKKVVTTDVIDKIQSHTNLINTGWQSAGVSGSYYKRVGDVLTVKYSFRGTGGDYAIANIPSSIFVAPQSYMMVIARWSVDGGANTHIQINAGASNMIALNTANGEIYVGQLTIML